MFPPNSTKTFVSASIMPGPVVEDKISNKDYLWSFLEYSCWLRPVVARQYLRTIEDVKSREIERLAALAAFYQVAGQVVEDAMTNLIAWSLWSQNKEGIMLADIMEKLQLRFGQPTSPFDRPYRDHISSRLQKQRIDVYAREYLSEILQHPENDLPLIFGVKWKKDPSVKLVPKAHRPLWDTMGYWISECIKPLTDERGQILSTCYNKIKHGPQLIVASPRESANKRGHPISEQEALHAKPTLRLLHKGARVQETMEELQQGKRSAPFILDSPENIRRWYFQQIVHTSNFIFGLGTWIYNSNFISEKRDLHIKKPEVEEIVREQGVHNQRTFGNTRAYWEKGR